MRKCRGIGGGWESSGGGGGRGGECDMAVVAVTVETPVTAVNEKAKDSASGVGGVEGRKRVSGGCYFFNYVLLI